jgi:hypothetical protein
MPVSDSPPLDLAELQRLLVAADPAALLMRPRLLRRVMKYDRRLKGIGLQVPHRKTYTIQRDALLRLLARDELQRDAQRQLPAKVILIQEPDANSLISWTRAQTLLKYWRLLFHSRMHLALEERAAEAKLTDTDIRKRIQQIGPSAFDEIRAVLKEENFLLPPEDERAVYVEFLALYWELCFFAHGLRFHYFPSLRDVADIARITAADVDPEQVFASTRLEGAPDPKAFVEASRRRNQATSGSAAAGAAHSERAYRKDLARAEAALARGNAVRAAILRQRASLVAGAEHAPPIAALVQSALDGLMEGLRKALQISDADAPPWRQALAALLGPAAQGLWPVEARLLYDLQKVCADHVRDIYALDLAAWLFSLGRRPIKRHLPNQGFVLMVKHMHSAAARLPACRIAPAERHSLAGLLRHAVARSEEQLGQRLRPLVQATLDEVRLQPHNFPERVARNKLSEELLDLVSERGFVTLGDLRDVVSRNNLKLADLGGADEFFLGDPLIRANRKLSVALDGVYRRGEIYLRWLQRLSSLAFGTRPGRFLMRYLVLPYGIAYVALEGTLHLLHMVQRWTGQPRTHLLPVATLITVAVLGTFLLALMQVPWFRHHVLGMLRHLAGIARLLCLDLPAAFFRLAVVQRILDSQPFAVVANVFLKPAAITAALALIYPLYGIRARPAWISSGVIFASISLLLSTRFGRTLEEAVIDALVRTWMRFRLSIFPALFAFTMAIFRGLVEAVERVLYTVDEWLRYRTGQSRLALVAKTVLGFFWFFITYLVRIYVNLFVEPTVNPIKHFPVVTVSAKLIVPFIPFLFQIFETPFLPLGPAFAKAMATMNIILLPGIFGFLVWELKENWRLYQANRSPVLQPVLIGHHGETLARYLKPEFHSGTVPRLYTRLRRADRSAYRYGKETAAHRHREALHHIEERVRRFVDREFLVLLCGSRGWENRPIRAGAIHVGSNRIAIEFRNGKPADNAWIAFEERSGWLVARLARTGWLSELNARQCRTWQMALAGIYKLAGADVIAEQIEASFAPGTVALDIQGEGLLAWRSTDQELLAVYHLDDRPLMKPTPAGAALPPDLPVLDPEKVLFINQPIRWDDWVQMWEADQTGTAGSTALLQGLCLLSGERFDGSCAAGRDGGDGSAPGVVTDRLSTPLGHADRAR